jgi:hypothetical protein
MKTIRRIDYSEDLETLKNFTDEFDSNFSEKLRLKVYKDSLPMDYIKRGAVKIYTVSAREQKNFKDTLHLRAIQPTLVWLKSSINPNGIKDSTDIARTFTIDFQVRCEKRVKWGRNWFEDNLIKFYGYGRTVEEIINEFNSFVESDEFQKLYLK